MDNTPTLELVRHDDDANAPELSIQAIGLEVACETTPESFYDKSLPEAVTKTPEPSIAPLETSESRINKSLKKRLRATIIVCLISVAVISIGVGIGLGVGFKNRNKTAAESSKLLLTPSSTSTALSKSTPTASSTPSKILNDTSIAAHHRPNGDRHLFFQDNTGAVRQAMYSKSLNQWIRTLDLVVTLDAKNHSPLAAVIWDDDLEDVALPKFQLFYISTTDHIASTTFGGRTWSDMKPFNSFLGYRAAPHSRHLSAVSIRNAMPNPYNNLTDIHLYFENILGYVTLLHTVQNNNNLSGPRNYEHKLWSNFSDYLYVDEKGPSYTVPISCKSWSSSSSSDTAYSLIVMDTAVTTDGADPPLYGNPTVIEFSHTPSNGSKYSYDVRRLSQGSPIFASQYIKNSDIAIISDGTAFSVWVENAKLVQLELGEGAKTRPMPQASFPFTRLASASHNIRSPTTFLYHQIDGSTFAEEQWDDSVQFWLSPVNISV